jgi:glutamate-1-semialdehyde 2,1-aminomutase
MKYKTNRSKELFQEAKNYLVGGVASSLHKAEHEEYPVYASHGKGSRFWDIDGNEYIDYMGSFGPSLLGFSNDELNEAVCEQIDKGTHFALPTESVNQLSKRLSEVIPCAEMVGYQSSGTEANLVNFRLARSFTGKNKILKFEGHYHGWADELSISVRPTSLKSMGPYNKPWKCLESAGQLEASAENIIVLPWNDVDLLEKTIKRHKHELAAVITEPIMYNAEPIKPLPGYLEAMREITKDNDVLLIFDEVITGFRVALGGAQEIYNIKPDLVTFAKAFAGGYPIAGVGGPKEILQSGVHPAGTFNANPLCVAAANKTLEIISRPGTYEKLNLISTKIKEGVNDLAEKYNVKLWCDSLASIWQLSFGIDQPMKNFRDNFKVDKLSYLEFYKRCLNRGIRLHSSRGRFYISTTHTEEDVDTTLTVFDDVFKEMFK